MLPQEIDNYSRLARAIALQFGNGCEVVVHDLESEDHAHSIVAIENGHITGREVGDGPSHVVLEALKAGKHGLTDRLSYLTRTSDGKILKSSTTFIRNASGEVVGIFAINFDITIMRAFQDSFDSMVKTQDETSQKEPEAIMHSVADLLDDLIDQSVELVGKPVQLMSKEDKVRAIRYLNETGAFLITKSGPKVCKYFGISKYTLYSYLDEARSQVDEA